MQRWTGHCAEVGSKTWPRKRTYHSAVALHDLASIPAHPCLLISCGWDDDTDLGDMWILSIREVFWENVSVPLFLFMIV